MSDEKKALVDRKNYNKEINDLVCVFNNRYEFDLDEIKNSIICHY